MPGLASLADELGGVLEEGLARSLEDADPEACRAALQFATQLAQCPLIGGGWGGAGGEQPVEFVEVVEPAEFFLEFVQAFEAATLSSGRGGQDEPELGFETLLPASPRMEDLGFAGVGGVAALPAGLAEAAFEAGHDAGGSDPGSEKPGGAEAGDGESASDLPAGGVGRQRGLAGCEPAPGELPHRAGLVAANALEQGGLDGVFPGAGEVACVRSDGVIESQQVGVGTSVVGEAQERAEGLGDEAELVDGSGGFVELGGFGGDLGELAADPGDGRAGPGAGSDHHVPERAGKRHAGSTGGGWVRFKGEPVRIGEVFMAIRWRRSRRCGRGRVRLNRTGTRERVGAWIN